jgi:hypothetical protein
MVQSGRDGLADPSRQLPSPLPPQEHREHDDADRHQHGDHDPGSRLRLTSLLREPKPYTQQHEGCNEERDQWHVHWRMATSS